VGQFGHDLEHLPLPEGFDLLTIFKCSNMDCDSWWNPFTGGPFFHLFKASAISAVESPDPDWNGKGIYPPPGIEFNKFGPTNVSIVPEVGFPYAIRVKGPVLDYPGWEECPSWRKIKDSILFEYMEVRPIEGTKLLGHPKWVQGPDYPRCRCRAKMKQLVQIDASEVALGDSGRMHIFYCDRWCGGVSALAAVWQCS